jgi:simple sugar transport system permease protein
MQGIKRLAAKLHNVKAADILIIFILIQVGAITASLIFPNSFRYLSTGNLQILFRAIPTLGIIVIGVNLLMISGEFDLSVGSTFALSALLMAKAFNAGVPIFFAILIALAVGMFIGFINGVLTTRSGVPSFIITLGAMWFWRGMILLISQSANETFLAGPVVKKIFTGSIGVIQFQFIWFVFLSICAWFILERHQFGNSLFAVGGNRKAAEALGINVRKTKIIAFTILGGLAAFAGVISTVRVSAVSPVQGDGLELQAIAACVIGGTLLTGGGGSVLGAFLGAAIFFTIQDILLLLRAPGSYLQLFVGVVIISAAFINEHMKRKRGI